MARDRKTGLKGRAVRRAVRLMIDEVRDRAWPTRVARDKLHDVLAGRAGLDALKAAAERIDKVDAGLMMTLANLEQLLRGAFPEARSMRQASKQLTLLAV